MNPGTSEMQFVSALDRVPAMRGVLCLHETVCAGAADGYARMTGMPAATLLHLGPGLANGLSNFHNARKARSPVVNIVGEHSTAHLRYDAPLTADVEAFARPVSGWVRTLDCAENMGAVASDCVAAAIQPPGQVASLIIPADHSWSQAGEPGPAVARPTRPLPERQADRRSGRSSEGYRWGRHPAQRQRSLRTRPSCRCRALARGCCSTATLPALRADASGPSPHASPTSPNRRRKCCEGCGT